MTDHEDTFIRISPKEMYDTLKRVEGKVDLLGSQAERLDDHEKRLRALESRFVGVSVAAVTLVLVGLTALIWKVFVE